MAKVATSGALEHAYVDCRGEPLCTPGETGCVVNSVLDNCGACGGLNLLDPPEGTLANFPLLCDLTEAGCACLEEWTVPAFTGAESCGTFSGCNNYDPVSGLPCFGFFSNMSPEDWQAEGRSYCKVSTDCPYKMTSQFDYAECIPPPTTDCAGNHLAVPTEGGGVPLDRCGVCGGDGTSCGMTNSGCQCLDSYIIPLQGCSGTTLNSCQPHTAEGLPCNPLVFASTAEFADAYPGQSYCVVDVAECSEYDFSVNDVLLAYCRSPTENAGTDECLSSPCANDGVCTDSIETYTCACEADWGGDNCEDSVNARQRTCADTDADGIEDNYNCDAHENSLGASPADAVCAGDVCTDDECCTMQQVEALCPSEHAVCMEQPQCVDEMSAVETVLSSPNTTAAFDELYVCFVLETLVDSASPCSAELETCARTASCRSIIGSEDNGAQCAADHACAAYLECSSPTVIPRTCADTDADGIEDNYNCDAHENSLGASPADAVC
eukprot:COSAG02_NODE_2076_length_9917_cov_906.312589_1_plen_494_part_10